MRMSFFAGLAVCSLAVVSTPALATEAETLAEAITDGKVELNFRYRAESVEQTGFALDAFSSTLRTKLKYTSGVFKGFSGVLEFDNVTNIGANAFNSTVNGRTRFPVIADPQITEVNQAYLAYTGIDDTKLMAGRVALNMNNQRFFGTVGWRQNDQTWDMLGFINSSIPDLTLTGAYVWNVNRIFGNDHPLGDLDTNTVLIDAKYSGLGFGNLTSYALLIDLNDAPVLGRSSQTYGIRFDGKHKMADGGFTVLYEAEYATQSDYSSNPTNFNVDYFHIAGGLSAAGFTAKLGFETLGTDNGNFAFQTPFATLHKFNGWADIFLNTPAGGLEDIYGSLSYKVQGDGPVSGLKFDAVYHDFSADTGGSYGSEINLQISKNFMKHYSFGIKFADYQADGFATDTQKIWITLGAAF